MNESNSINTWDLLKEFGFQPDNNVISDVLPGLYYDFGNFKLTASCVMHWGFAEVVSFSGVLRTTHSLAEVRFEMPRFVKSREECAAWITYNLDEVGKNGKFIPSREVPWLKEGRQHKNLLPWEQERAAYNSRPCCFVQREWMKLALKDLTDILSYADDDEAVLFDFDGRVLTIKCADKSVLVAAEGSAWPSMFQLFKRDFRRLPKRLMNPIVEVSIWETRLLLGSYRYEVFSEVPKEIRS